MMSRSELSSPDSRQATIATVERETGLSKDTLRVWERRYGFPQPARDSHGERVYPPEQLEKLRVISRLLDRGMRPGRLMGLALPELLQRFQAQEPVPPAATGRAAPDGLNPMMDEAIELLKAYDEVALRTHFARVLLRLGLQRFTIEFVGPLNERVGDAWARGEIAVSEEHIYTEQMQHVLRQGIGSIPAGPQSPSVMLTTLPGEQHQLGLLMANICLAAEGARCIALGVQTPAWDIVHAVQRQGTEVVGLSFSEALRLKAAYAMLEDLRDRLPAQIEIWAGGKLWARAPRPVPGVRFVTSLTQIPGLLAAHRGALGRREPS
jgi:methanogenic corrinoid protein MtbC1